MIHFCWVNRDCKDISPASILHSNLRFHFQTHLLLQSCLSQQCADPCCWVEHVSLPVLADQHLMLMQNTGIPSSPVCLSGWTVCWWPGLPSSRYCRLLGDGCKQAGPPSSHTGSQLAANDCNGDSLLDFLPSSKVGYGTWLEISTLLEDIGVQLVCVLAARNQWSAGCVYACCEGMAKQR